jgi:hypothetical protein
MLSVDTSSYQKFLNEFVNDSTISKQSFNDNEQLDHLNFQNLVDRLDEGLTYDVPIDDRAFELEEDELSNLDADFNTSAVHEELALEEFGDMDISQLDSHSQDDNQNFKDYESNFNDNKEFDYDNCIHQKILASNDSNASIHHNQDINDDPRETTPKLKTHHPPFQTPVGRRSDSDTGISTPFFTPRTTYETPQYNSHLQSSINELLKETRDECQNLRILNEKLIIAGDDYRQKVGIKY